MHFAKALAFVAALATSASATNTYGYATMPVVVAPSGCATTMIVAPTGSAGPGTNGSGIAMPSTPSHALPVGGGGFSSEGSAGLDRLGSSAFVLLVVGGVMMAL